MATIPSDVAFTPAVKTVQTEKGSRAAYRRIERGYPVAVQRAILFDIEAWDVNCPQHIHRRTPESKVQSEIERLKREIDALKARLGDAA